MMEVKVVNSLVEQLLPQIKDHFNVETIDIIKIFDLFWTIDLNSKSIIINSSLRILRDRNEPSLKLYFNNKDTDIIMTDDILVLRHHPGFHTEPQYLLFVKDMFITE